MRTIRTKVYKFDELSKAAQNKAVELLHDINTDFEWWDATKDFWAERLNEQGFENAKIWFSGFSSQGDGACFDADINLAKFTNDKRIIAIAESYCGFHIAKTSNANRYSHERTRYIDYDALDNKYIRINEALQALSEKIEATRLELSKEIYRDLENECNYRQSREAIIETIKANDYDFFKDGKLYDNR